MIPAFEAITAIERLRADSIVVSTMTPNSYWKSVSEDRTLDLPIYGGMGKASSVALGLALAVPDRKILVLDGDGGLLMNLGSLVTIAEQQPRNLVHVVFEDGVYFTTGAQPVPGAGSMDLAGIARAAGIEESYQFSDLEDFVTALPDLMEKAGPVFVCLKVSHGDDVPPIELESTGDAMRRVADAIAAGEHGS